MKLIKNNTVVDKPVVLLGRRTDEEYIFQSVFLDERSLQEFKKEVSMLCGVRYDYMIWFRKMTQEEVELFAPLIRCDIQPKHS